MCKIKNKKRKGGEACPQSTNQWVVWNSPKLPICLKRGKN